MSHIAEEYAKNLGVKMGLPIVGKHFYPVLHEKYITIHSTNKTQSKDYDFFGEVVSLIRPFLQSNDIKIIQIGLPSDSKIGGCDQYIMDVSIKQLSYVLSRSSLHVGVDSMPTHLASALDIPIIALYSNMWSSQCGPLWNRNSVAVLKDSPKKGNPCYSFTENPKTINEIKPEEVSKSILNSLGIDGEINFKSVYVGRQYFGEVSQIIPDFFDPNLPINNVFIRDDLKKDDTLMYIRAWCNHTKCVIVSDRVFPDSVLAKIAPNTVRYQLNVNNENMGSEIERLKRSGIELCLESQCSGEKLKRLRECYFDYLVQEDRSESADLDLSGKKFLTKKPIFSSAGLFLSKAHWKLGKKALDKWGEIIDNEAFRDELDFFYIYE